jgi:hypothetical protein
LHVAQAVTLFVAHHVFAALVKKVLAVLGLLGAHALMVPEQEQEPALLEILV